MASPPHLRAGPELGGRATVASEQIEFIPTETVPSTKRAFVGSIGQLREGHARGFRAEESRAMTIGQQRFT